MTAVVVGALAGTIIVSWVLIEWLDLLPRRHWLREAHRAVFVGALLLAIWQVPAAYQTAMNWIIEREQAKVQEIVDRTVDQLEQQQEQRRVEREQRTPPTTAVD